MLKTFSKRVLKCLQKSTSAIKGFQKVFGKVANLWGSKIYKKAPKSFQNLQMLKKVSNKSFLNVFQSFQNDIKNS